jgi:hypothetical protein
MTRHQRQLDELRALCCSGRIDRAVDLAFEHFDCFGRDELVVALLGDAIGHTSVAPPVLARFVELTEDSDAPDWPRRRR